MCHKGLTLQCLYHEWCSQPLLGWKLVYSRFLYFWYVLYWYMIKQIWKKWQKFTVWFSFYKASNKTQFQPLGSEQCPKLITWYIENQGKRHIYIGLYIFFSLWLSENNITKASMMHLWHTNVPVHVHYLTFYVYICVLLWNYIACQMVQFWK